MTTICCTNEKVYKACWVRYVWRGRRWHRLAAGRCPAASEGLSTLLFVGNKIDYSRCSLSVRTNQSPKEGQRNENRGYCHRWWWLMIDVSTQTLFIYTSLESSNSTLKSFVVLRIWSAEGRPCCKRSRRITSRSRRVWFWSVIKPERPGDVTHREVVTDVRLQRA